MEQLNRHKKAWSHQEVDLLKTLAENHGTKFLSVKLGRTEKAIQKKLRAIFKETSHFSLRCKISTNSVARMLGISKGKVVNWIEQKGLPAKKVKLKSGFHYEIEYDYFMSWFKQNYKTLEIDFTQISPNAFPCFVPKWIEAESFRGSFYGKQRLWTKQEEELLLDLLFNTQKSRRDIATTLDRSLVSVNKKIARLHKKMTT